MTKQKKIEEIKGGKKGVEKERRKGKRE